MYFIQSVVKLNTYQQVHEKTFRNKNKKQQGKNQQNFDANFKISRCVTLTFSMQLQNDAN